MLEMKVPSPGESISEVEIAEWLVEDGDYVEKDQAIAEVDSDKATLELPAEESGIITLKAEEGDTVAVGEVVCLIDTDAPRPEGLDKKEESSSEEEKTEKKEDKKEEAAPNPNPVKKEEPKQEETYAKGHPSVSAKKIMDENNISSKQVNGTGPGGRILKSDVVSAMAGGFSTESAAGWGGTREQRKEKMSMLRRKIAERLVGVKNETAMLTTFNEVDMKPIMDIRAKYKMKFKEELGVSLGFMSFFTKAVTEALIIFQLLMV